MRRAAIALGVVAALLGVAAVAALVLAGRLEAELGALDVSDAEMAAAYHRPGTPCVRYGADAPSAEALGESAARLLALGLAADGLGALYGHLYALEESREAQLHARSLADEYLAQFERTLEGRPLQQLVFRVERRALRAKLEAATATADMEAAGAEAWGRLSSAQQEGVLALLRERPQHFRPRAFVRLVSGATQLASRPDAGSPPAAPAP